MGADKRKFERFPARLEVEIRTRGRGQICPSADVSRHGMFLTTSNPPHERQLLILRIPVPDEQPPIDVMASVVRRHSPPAGGGPGSERAAGMGINFFALTEENKNRWEAFLAKLRGEAPRAAEEGAENNRPTFLLQPRDVGRLKLFETRDFAQGSMFLRTPVLREIDEIIKVMLLHPVTDEEFPLLARVSAVHNGSKTEPKGMTLEFLPIDAEIRDAFHAFVEHGMGSLVALRAVAAAPPSGKEIRPLFEAGPEKSDAESGEGALDGIEEMRLVTEEELSSDRMIDLLSDLEIGPPQAAGPTPGTKPPVRQSSPSTAPVTPPAENQPQLFPASLTSVPPVPETPPPSAETLQLWEELRIALQAAPEDVSLLFRLGSALAREKTTAFEAIGFLQRLLALEPHHPLANGALALAYAQIGQKAAAERHLSRARRMGQLIDARVQALLAASPS